MTDAGERKTSPFKMGLLTRLRLLVLILVGGIFIVFGTWLYAQGKRQILEEARKQYQQFGTLVGTMIFRNYEMTNTSGIQAYLLSLQGIGPDLQTVQGLIEPRP